MKLNIGAGNLPIEGYVNVDKYYYPTSSWELTNHKLAKEWIDGKYEGEWKYGDALDLKFQHNYFDEINMSHILEHLSMEEGNRAIIQAYNVLKPEGFIDIAVPDLEKACELFSTVKYKDVDNSMWFYVMGMIYGTTGKDGEGQFHHCGYSRYHLKILMEDNKFKNIIEVHGAPYHKPELNFCLRGYK